MPRYLDQVQLGRALRDHANSPLEVIAANEDLHSHYLRRFKRDEPPQYESDTSSEYSDDSAPSEDPQQIMERPIYDRDRKWIAFAMGPNITPGQLYLKEAKREEKRIMKKFWVPIFSKPKGIRRQGIVVRHNMKKRWEKLGIWNPAWGFAGRNVQPNDEADDWDWRWAQDAGENTVPDRRDKESDLILRTLNLRKNLRRGEHVPIEPQSCLGQDATASQAEAFLSSRPWFIFQLELTEELLRYSRLSAREQELARSPRKQVIDWWKERGHWRDEFDEEGVTSWKWRHESPSPEPEDLTPIQNMDEFDLLDAMVMDFTPSEIDDLETNELPPEEQPKSYWVAKESAGIPEPAFPGQMPEPWNADYYSPRMPIARSAPAPGSGTEATEEADDGILPSGEAPEQKSLRPRGNVSSYPPETARRGRLRQPQNKTDIARDHGQSSPEPRRSARIAGTKRAAESVPSDATPNKKSKGRKASHANQLSSSESRQRKKRPAPARPPPQRETGALPKRGRGRPKKEVPGLVAPEPAPADTVTEEEPRRTRGRPRKEALGRSTLHENLYKRGRGRPKKGDAAITRSAVMKNR